MWINSGLVQYEKRIDYMEPVMRYKSSWGTIYKIAFCDTEIDDIPKYIKKDIEKTKLEGTFEPLAIPND